MEQWDSSIFLTDIVQDAMAKEEDMGDSIFQSDIHSGTPNSSEGSFHHELQCTWSS